MTLFLKRHEDLSDAAVGHSANAGQCSSALLLCILHLWHRWSSTLGRCGSLFVFDWKPSSFAGLLRQRCYINETYQRHLIGLEGFQEWDWLIILKKISFDAFLNAASRTFTTRWMTTTHCQTTSVQHLTALVSAIPCKLRLYHIWCLYDKWYVWLMMIFDIYCDTGTINLNSWMTLCMYWFW